MRFATHDACPPAPAAHTHTGAETMRHPPASPAPAVNEPARHAGCRACTMALTLAGCALLLHAGSSSVLAAPDDDAVAHALLERTNALRVASGWAALVAEPRLTEAAERFATFMAA